MQTYPIYLSSDEDPETQYQISDRDLINDQDGCWLNQVLIHPNDPTDGVAVTIPSVDVVAQQLKHLALLAHSEVQKQTSACIVCGKPYEQVLEEATAEYLRHTAELAETVSEAHLKRQAFIA